MSETMGQESWKQPMQCWGYGINILHKDFLQRGDKVRTMHNVQQVVIVEDMGRNVPRIYIALDKKKDEF
jgi:hypothetical protein